MTDTDKPHFILELNLMNTGHKVKVEDPTILTDKIMDQAWGMVSDFLMDALDDLDPDITDERFREIFIELCYKLIYREMTTLHLLPLWEENFKKRLASGKRIQRWPRRKGDS